jgi:photosystem II stability/assembly factor-like uncharacterized protein
MALRKALFGIMLLGTMLAHAAFTHAVTYDILKLPAVQSEKASKAPLFVIKKFGDRYWAAGAHGHIIYSDDGGDTWTQAEEVPVRSTLLDIFFINSQLGWAVGHEGVILHTTDGGKTWKLQYDGLRYGQEGLEFYTKLAEENPDDELYPYLVDEMEFAISQGADKPLFMINFYDEKHGHAIGAYGMILVTYDGGEHWEHRLHNMDNESFNHIFDFAPLPGTRRYFLSGEAGLLLIGDVDGNRAERVHAVPWEGSFFTTVAASDGAIIMGGLRGRMFRTTDEGSTWTVVEKPATSSIVASIRLADGRLLAAGVAGEVLVSTDDGHSFTLSPAAGKVSRIYDMAEGEDDNLLVVGPYGVKSVPLSQQ